jgi:hypothetical protein
VLLHDSLVLIVKQLKNTLLAPYFHKNLNNLQDSNPISTLGVVLQQSVLVAVVGYEVLHKLVGDVVLQAHDKTYDNTL